MMMLRAAGTALISIGTGFALACAFDPAAALLRLTAILMIARQWFPARAG